MEQTFGARLRAVRERRQIALSDIANNTKIKISALEAIERDDISKLPEGLFRRAYVRAYAEAVGLDAAETVREFLALYPAPAELSTEPDLGPPTRFGRAVANAVAALPVRRSKLETALEPVESSAVESNAEAREIDLCAVAELCTSLARAGESHDVERLLGEAVSLFGAVGLVVWMWEPRLSSLRAGWSHGYPDAMTARLPRVMKNADNAIAAAFRNAETRIVDSSGTSTGAIVVPIATPCGCIAVLAIELQHGDEQRDGVRAVATIIAAQIAALLGATTIAEAVTA